MATLVRGQSDEMTQALVDALVEYERTFPGSDAAIYRQNPGSIRVRIVDNRFEGMSRSRRHDEVWEFLRDRVGDDVMGEVSLLLPLPTAELGSSLANLEFEQPSRSAL